MSSFVNSISHFGDIFAIPLFALMIFYFNHIEHKTQIEYVLYFFSICGFILDIIFTYLYYNPMSPTKT
jgi:hypothetical protein